jgi:LAO/AO transport system kinase
MLMLMVPPGGGDDLQGIKKGIVEVADMLVITKSDGKFTMAAKHTAADYRGSLRTIAGNARPGGNMKGWEIPPVLLVSSHEQKGLEKVWEEICRYRKLMIETGNLDLKRQQQARYWMWKNVRNLILEKTRNDPVLKGKAISLEIALNEGKTTPRLAATELLDSLVQRADD